jgi:hypothetical protein
MANTGNSGARSVKICLAECAEKLSVNGITADYHKFKDELYNNFLLSLICRNPKHGKAFSQFSKCNGE